MEITTNRVDARTITVIAREISAIYDLNLKPITASLPPAKGKNNISVRIDVPQFALALRPGDSWCEDRACAESCSGQVLLRSTRSPSTVLPTPPIL